MDEKTLRLLLTQLNVEVVNTAGGTTGKPRTTEKRATSEKPKVAVKHAIEKPSKTESKMNADTAVAKKLPRKTAAEKPKVAVKQTIEKPAKTESKKKAETAAAKTVPRKSAAASPLTAVARPRAEKVDKPVAAKPVSKAKVAATKPRTQLNNFTMQYQ